MTAIARTVGDTRTMLRRQMLHQVRYPSITVMLLAMPVIILFLFVYVFGGTMGAGLVHGSGREAYLQYVLPGILLIAIASVAQGTSIAVAMDMTQGIVARFRSMSISRTAVLSGHVSAAILQNIACLGVVLAVSYAMGFRATATPIEWIATWGVLVMVAVALTWVTVALGISSSTVESASNLPMPLLLLPFLSSGFIPTATLPPAIRWFAEHQPFTAFVDTIRGLLMGTAIGSSALASISWCVVLTATGHVVSRRAYERRSIR
jgi:ABC-2 type transport system permease protein